MSDSMEVRKEQYIGWATENLGDKTGIWYAPYLEKLGSLLKRFGLGADYYENFFYYRVFSDFKDVYQKITEETEADTIEVLKGKQKRYTKPFVAKNETWKKSYAQM